MPPERGDGAYRGTKRSLRGDPAEGKQLSRKVYFTVSLAVEEVTDPELFVTLQR